jgi:glycosyltransferase involved in cell wall biosynthesis
MKIIVFKYGDLPPTSSFLRRHIEDIAGGDDNFMYLEDWSLPKLGDRPLWSTDLVSKGIRWLLIKAGYDRKDLHRRAFASALRRTATDAVLAEFGYSGAHIWAPCRDLGIPLVVHFHGTDVNRRELVAEHLDGYRKAFEYATALIAVSNHDRERLIELGAPEEKIYVIPCGATFPTHLEIDERSKRTYNIVSVTRFASVKAPQLTLLAYDRYLTLGGQGHLHMVGDGALLPFCKTLVQGLGITNQVTFHGLLPHEEVLQLLQRSHLYVQHSVVAPDGDCEGMPVSIMEAAGHRLPIVTTVPGGISEHIKHQKTGYVVEQYDVDGMARHMYELWRNRKEADRIAGAAYEMARRKFDAERQTEKLKAIILDACSASTVSIGDAPGCVSPPSGTRSQ